jgi:hypothetical protein
MARRWTDSNKWEDAWFMDLPSKYKLFWLYLCDKCDHAGVWEVNWRMAQFIVGENLEPAETKRLFKDRIIEVDNGRYWYLKKFIDFQQGTHELNPANKCHKSIISILNKFNLLEQLQNMKVSPYQAPTKPLARGYSNSNGNSNSISKKDIIYTKNFERIWQQYPKPIGKKNAFKHFKATVHSKKDLEKIELALNNYKQSKTVSKGMVQNGSTWFNQWEDWVELPETEKFCEKCKGKGYYYSTTGYKVKCSCFDGQKT